VPAPWIQIKILKLLAILGQANQRASEGMYAVLGEVIKRSDVGSSIGYAVMYECVRTITKIYPQAALLELAAMRCVPGLELRIEDQVLECIIAAGAQDASIYA
jgi:AP-4 complex subunit epsilon-1